MAWKGIQGASVLETEDDVLEQCYGRSPDSGGGPKKPKPFKPVAKPTLAAEPPPAAEPEPAKDAASLAAELENLKKDELVALADSLGLDSSGTKAEIAKRIADHQTAS